MLISTLNPLPKNEQKVAYEVLKAWNAYTVTGHTIQLWITVREWNFFFRSKGGPDEFAGCYFHDGSITSKGLELRMEAGVRKNAE